MTRYFSSSLRSDQNFRQAYNFDGQVVRAKSSIYGLAVVRNSFPASYIVEQLLKFVASVVDDRGDPKIIQYAFKNLMRFAVVERLLPDRNKKDSLVRYYEQIKRTVPWEKTEPHYWVQYAMALLTFQEFDRAQTLLDQAYALARSRYGYHTNNIDTQQGRLYLLRCLHAQDGVAAAAFFDDAHKVLCRIPG